MAEPGALEYFYGTEAEQYTFYPIPKVLFTAPGFKQTTGDAKILYGLMLDRMGLSVRNDWLDKQNRVFIYFTEAGPGPPHQNLCQELHSEGGSQDFRKAEVCTSGNGKS